MSIRGSYRQVETDAFWQEENEGLGTDTHLSAVVSEQADGRYAPFPAAKRIRSAISFGLERRET
jgi:hypothetical protein